MKLPSTFIFISTSVPERGGAAVAQPATSVKHPHAGAAGTKPAPASSAEHAVAAAVDLEKEIEAANRKLADDGREIRFEYDRDASKVVVKLIDASTHEVLRQFPSNEALRIARLANAGKSLLNILA